MESSIKLIIFLSGIILLIVSGYSFSQRRISQTYGFAGFCIVSALYSIGYSFELGVSNVAQVYFALKIEYLGVSFIPIAITVMTFELIDRRDLLKRWLLLTMFALSLITYGLVFTSEYHSLYYSSMTLREVFGITVVDVERSLWYYVYMIYVNMTIVITMAVMATMAIKSRGDLRKQYFILFAAISMPAIGSTLYYAGLSPYGIDPTPFSITITAGILSYAVYNSSLVTIATRIREVVFDNMSLIVVILNKNNRVIDYNEGFMRFIKMDDKAILGKKIDSLISTKDSLLELVTNDDIGSDSDDISNSKGISEFGKFYSRIFVVKDKKITINSDINKTYKASKSLIVNKFGKVVAKYVVLSDITSESKILSKLDHQAKHDQLTQIMNRTAFFNMYKALIENMTDGNWMSILMVDIDHFKKVNDTYGHLAGDEVLKSIANLFESRIRDNDLVFRYGGEEFIILMMDTDMDSAVLLANRLRVLVEENSVTFNGNEINVTISIGVESCVPSCELKIEDLIERADDALYKAKNSGRNRVETNL